MRRTHGTLAVARVLLANPQAEHYGWNIRKAADVRSATVYRVLDRLLDAGWLTAQWEDPANAPGRPRRRFYQVTEAGRQGLIDLLAGQ